MNAGLSLIATIGLVALATGPLAAHADEESDRMQDADRSEATSERCVSLSRISSTDVVDDYTVLFYMRGGDVYVNRLPHRCPGLRAERKFMYRTSLAELCDLDTITVLRGSGIGFMPGPSCGLGQFQPITKEAAKALKDAPPRLPEEREVPTAEPEEIDSMESTMESSME